MKIRKVLALFATTAIILGITSVSSLAATFNLDVSFNGQTMKLSSNDLSLNALNLLPGETDTSVINIENKGSEKVQLFMTAKIVDDQSLLDILDILVTDSENNELFKGGYDEFKKIEISLDKSEKEVLTIKTTMPESAGNEYQNKEANIKFIFEANGEEVIPEPEPEPEPIIPDTPKTNQSRIVIYSVLLGIVAILIIALIVLTINKNKKEEDNK